LFLEHNENYFIKRPIKHGFFNLKNGEESIKSVARDLERIIEYILIKKVNLKRSQLPNYNVILVIPDVF
jgi:hypothetical protein